MIIRPTRQTALRPARHTKTGREPARLAVCLTMRDRWILRMCHEHRVLTSPQLAALAFTGHIDLARHRLAKLHRYGVLDRFRPLRSRGSAPTHWVLAAAGAAVLAAEAGLDVTDLRFRADRALAIAHSLHLAHAVGVSEWFTTLTAAALTEPDARVVAWWSQTRCQALWGDLARPDAYGRYTHTGTGLDFFLEYDLGTMALATVAAKLLGYGELARTTAVITPVLLWVPTGAREAAARKALHDTWTRLPDPTAVPVATAAADLLDTTAAHPGPADRVWLPLQATGTGRLGMHQLCAAWPRRSPVPATVPVPPASRHAVLAPPPPVPPAPGGR
ncbi:replication-relaxation family protein [Nocardia sp. NPDC059240]|uniref:replication-relaxation family protein n=1 Tax=Nocardia sp. NPDC059240 TaxID=3346786 RepID=UPI0036C23457